MSRFRVRIVYPDGTMLKCTVNRSSLNGFKLSAVRGASIKITKVTS